MRKFTFLLLVLIIGTMSRLEAAEVNVPGVSGITFDDAVPSVAISSDFTIHGLTISPNGLTLTYSADVFKLFGDATVKLGTDDLVVSFGTESNPGLQVTSGTFDQVSMGLTANFSLKSMGFAPSGLSFEWDNNNSVFEIFGAATVSFDSESMTVNLGDAATPGIEISNGALSKINLGVTADFSLKSLSFSPSGLTFQWDSTTDKFEIFGGASVAFDSETMTVGLGDAANPGIEINAGTVEKVNLSVTAAFNLKSLSFTPSGLTFQWDSSTNKFEIFGGASVAFDSETMTVGLGDAVNPGIEINAGTVEKVNLSVTAAFNLKSLSFTPSGLTFQWDSTTNKFEMFGSASVAFDSETMTVGLGDAANPGIEINAGTVEKVNLSVTANFNMKSLSFSPNNLTFQWDSAANHFEMFGAATVSFDSESIAVTMGDASSSGLVVSSGVVQSINLGLSASFNIKSLTFQTLGLTFQWDRSSNHFEIFGIAIVTFDGSSLLVVLGNDANPGLRIDGGVINHINMSIDGGFFMKGIEFIADGLTIEWDSAQNHFEIFGSATTFFEGESIQVSMGNASDPGIVVNGGVVQHINMGITADFYLKSMEFEAQGLTYHWDRSANRFEIYGSTTAKFDGESVSVSLGNDSDPGIAVQNGVIQHINMGLSGNINLRAMTIKPQNLTFHYDRGSSQYEMYGSAHLTLEGHDAGVSMGTNANPGLVFRNSVLEHINMSITEDFQLKGLTVKTNNLGVQWDRSTNHFNFYGDMELDIANESINANMGTSSNPGMQFRNGRLHSFDVTVNSNFKLGNLQVTTRNVEVRYQSNKFYMTGEIEVDEVWSVIVDLGRNGSNGLEIDTSHHPDKLKLTDFKIEVDHVDLGAIDFKKVEISFQNDVIHDAELDVSIPPGYEVDAKMTFAGNPARLNSIDIAFDATSLSTAIPLADTGIELVHMQGGMFNLANPSNYVWEYINGRWQLVRGVYFKGSAAFVFGGPANIAGRQAALIYNRDDVIITSSEADLQASLLVGAYRQGHNDWRSILGDGSINMDLIWGRSYSVSAYMKIPSDPVVDFTANARLSSNGTFDALMRVRLRVPRSVPIVGGRTLGSVDGAIRYNKRDLYGSYGAGWATYRFFGTHHFGARYKFGNRRIGIIGSRTINGINSQIHRELGGRPNPNNLGGTANPNDLMGSEGSEETAWSKVVRTFEIPANRSSLFIELDLGKVVDEAYVSVIGPDGFYDVYEIKKTEVDDATPPVMELADRITKFEADSAVNLLVINHEPENDALQEQFSTLTPGQYDVMISYRESNGIDSVGMQASYFHPVPKGEITAREIGGGLINLDMNYWASMPDSTSISIFWNDTTAYGGNEIVTLGYGQPDESGFAETSLVFNPNESVHNDNIYFYYVIQDSTNAPFYSNFTEPIKIESPINGTVVITNPDDETRLNGIMVFIDENGNGFYDTGGTSGTFEPHSVTDEKGVFHFNNLTAGQTYTIDIVVPYGHSLADGETGKRTFIYQGFAQTFTFNIKED